MFQFILLRSSVHCITLRVAVRSYRHETAFEIYFSAVLWNYYPCYNIWTNSECTVQIT